MGSFLTVFFHKKLSGKKGDQNLVHLLVPVTDNWHI